MAKFVCSVCGYVYEGDKAPEQCPVCKVGADKFVEQTGEMTWAAEHVVGVAKDVDEISYLPKYLPSNPANALPCLASSRAISWTVSWIASKFVKKELRANFEGECSEVGMYLAMARVAHREGYPEIGLYWEKAAYEEAEHAAKFAELLGEEILTYPFTL